MQIALTLVGPDSDAASLAVATLTPALAGAHARVKEPRILGDGAVDLLVEADAIAPVRAAAEAALAKWPVDVCVQPWNGRRKRLLIADMDSTIIGCECIDELADFAGVKAQVSAITERAMRGELDFEGALRERVAMLKGLPLSALQQAYDERVRLNPGARTLVRTMAEHGARCALVSGGFTFFTSRVAQAAGFHLDRANILHHDDHGLSGTVGEPILGREAKREALISLCRELKFDLSDSIAVGDGANDIDMIQAAGLGVAFRAKAALKAVAPVAIDHGDLTALLYLQGYRQTEFAAS